MTIMQTFILLCGLAAVLYGLITSRQILSLSTGNEKMVSIANAIQEGARRGTHKEATEDPSRDHQEGRRRYRVT